MHNILIMTNTTPVEQHKSEEISLDCEIAAPQPFSCGWFGSAKKLRDLEKFKHICLQIVAMICYQDRLKHRKQYI